MTERQERALLAFNWREMYATAQEEIFRLKDALESKRKDCQDWYRRYIRDHAIIDNALTYVTSQPDSLAMQTLMEKLMCGTRMKDTNVINVPIVEWECTKCHGDFYQHTILCDVDGNFYHRPRDTEDWCGPLAPKGETKNG